MPSASGMVRRPEAVAAHVLRRAETEAAATNGGSLKLTVAQEVADALNDAGSGYLTALRERTARTVDLLVDAAVTHEVFDVVIE